MAPRSIKRWILVLLSFFCLTLNDGAGAAATTVPVVSAGDPWARQIIQFLGGPYVTVDALESWDSSWRMRRNPKTDKNALVTIVLNRAQAQRLRLTSKAGTLLPNVRLLFESMPLQEEQEAFFYLDPAQLPFIAQRCMVLLAQLMPHHYLFFQRRLAEFETRLRSTILTGRSLLSGLSVWDPGGALSRLLQAAGCKLPLSPQEAFQQLEEWSPRVTTSRRSVEAMPWGTNVVLLDWMSTPAFKSKLADKPGVLVVDPFVGPDILLQIHQFYLNIAQMARSIPK